MVPARSGCLSPQDSERPGTGPEAAGTALDKQPHSQEREADGGLQDTLEPFEKIYFLIFQRVHVER